MKLVREALSRTIEDFTGLKEFKEEILESGFTSYCVKYEDDRNTIKKLYPNLDLSNIIPSGSKDGVVKEEAAPTQGGTLIEPEVVPIFDSTPEQRDRDGDES